MLSNIEQKILKSELDHNGTTILGNKTLLVSLNNNLVVKIKQKTEKETDTFNGNTETSYTKTFETSIIHKENGTIVTDVFSEGDMNYDNDVVSFIEIFA
tara:strand:- start:80 stop:376 length:297 start_codon:yes stop_codon:yes gene_type:complete